MNHELQGSYWLGFSLVAITLLLGTVGLIWRWWDKTVEGASALNVLPGYKCKYESSVLSKLSKSTVWHRKV